MFVASLIMSQAIFLCCNVKVKVETRLATDMMVGYEYFSNDTGYCLQLETTSC